MGVYIKGMEMPFTCLSCEFHKCSGGAGDYCTLTKKKQFRFKNRPSWCPLVSVSPHGRLIDADEISEHKYTTMPPYRREYCDGKPKSEDEVVAFKFGWNSAIDAITENAPTIIEAEEGE